MGILRWTRRLQTTAYSIQPTACNVQPSTYSVETRDESLKPAGDRAKVSGVEGTLGVVSRLCWTDYPIRVMPIGILPILVLLR